MAKLAIDVVLNKASAMTGLRGLEKDVTSFGKSILGVVGIGGGLAGIVAGIDNILAKAGQLQDVSDAFNVSAESIQRLGNVGVTANLSIEEIGSKLGKLAKAAQSAASGNDEMAKTFAKIGVTGQDLVRLNAEELFNKLREAVSSGALAGEEFKIVNELLAKDFQRFMPLLRMTSEEFNRLASAAGITSDAMVAFLDSANVRLRQFQQQSGAALTEAAASILFLADTIKENPVDFAKTFVGDLTLLDKLQAKLKAAKEFTEQERRARAGQEKMVVDQAELDRQGSDEAKLEEKIKQAEANVTAQLKKMLADSEEDRLKQDLADFKQAEKEKRDLLQKRADMIPDIEQLQAERAGPAAEMALLEKRAREAGVEARKTGTVEDVKTAEEAALRFQRAQEQDLRNRRLGEVAEQRARDITNQVVGALPMAGQLGQQLRDIPSSTEAQRTQPVKLENPPDLKGIMDKLDTLIKNAGVFS